MAYNDLYSSLTGNCYSPKLWFFSSHSSPPWQPAEKKKSRRYTRPHAEAADATTSEPDSPTPVTQHLNKTGQPHLRQPMLNHAS